jgi:peptidoglycan/xylan/chitin deacetylase (PgdA/CDA1 family)
MRWQSLAQAAISQGVAVARLPFPARPGLRILTYHTVGQAAYGDSLNLNTISVEKFKTHVEVLSAVRTRSIEGAPTSDSGLEVAITFDDGYSDNLHVVAPLLASRNIPFTVFVTAGFVQKKLPGFLSPAELLELSALPGVTIGAHGFTHCDLTTCSSAQLIEELTGSKNYIENLIGRKVTSMAYPYGSVNARVKQAVQDNGYTLATSSHFDVNKPGRDPLLMCRTVVLSPDTARVLKQKIRGDWDWYRWRTADPQLLINNQSI